jgi:2-pyrone-4,6-dicarboxylate lactonase
MRELSNPPDPNPKTPKLALPPGACDTHIHLFGPAEKFPVDPLSPYESRDQLAETNIALQERLGLSRAVVVSGGAYGRNYAVLEDALKRFPQRYRGVALMPDDTTDAEFARLTRLGVRGLRFISSARGMRQVPTLSEAVAARAAEHGWHVQFYPQQTDIIDNADRLLALPNRIVLDHFASVPAEGGIDQPAFKAAAACGSSCRDRCAAHGRNTLMPTSRRWRARWWRMHRNGWCGARIGRTSI